MYMYGILMQRNKKLMNYFKKPKYVHVVLEWTLAYCVINI